MRVHFYVKKNKYVKCIYLEPKIYFIVISRAFRFISYIWKGMESKYGHLINLHSYNWTSTELHEWNNYCPQSVSDHAFCSWSRVKYTWDVIIHVLTIQKTSSAVVFLEFWHSMRELCLTCILNWSCVENESL